MLCIVEINRECFDFNHCLLLVNFHDEDKIFLLLDFDLTSYLIAF